ncbi:uncharacterized protein [Triticum aestivum]|uniref:uncharacterized protein n=1 Tax=Triticum aestivum TaxID=4565 RepID=UPI001D022F50|nr:uncharacterized protein LOC123101322 [Triticum aestivum]
MTATLRSSSASKNPAPAGSFQPSGYFLPCYTVFLRITLYNLLQANDNFWKIQYDHEAAKRAERKTAKPTTSRKRKPSTSELFQLDDTDDNEEEGDTGNSQPVEEEQQQFENRRQTRTSKDAELSSGLPDTTRKRQTEDTSPLSGESMQSNMPAFKTAPGVQVKPGRKPRKINRPKPLW